MSVLAIDIGLKRIGVAYGVRGVAIPQKPILRKNRNQAANDVSKILVKFAILQAFMYFVKYFRLN